MIPLDLRCLKKNDVLSALGVGQLNYDVRFVYRDNKITRKEAELSAQQQAEFISRIMVFANWLKENDPATFKKIWSANWKFNYSERTARLMIEPLARWNDSRHNDQ